MRKRKAFIFGTGETFSFSNWGGPEPNNNFDEDYGLLWRRDFGSGPLWSWNDADPVTAFFDEHPVGYMIEYDGPFTPVPEPSSLVIWAVIGVGGLGIALKRRRK